MTTSSDMAAPISASVLLLPRASRAFLVGTTGTGKSTLAEVMLKEYQLAVPNLMTLIVDTKPRFKAERELNGLTTEQSGRYRKWGYGSGVIPGSYVLPMRGTAKSELDQVWRLGGSVAIAHAERKHERSWASHVATQFYEGYGAKRPRLLFVDELADFYEFRTLADIFQRVARNGRERDVALIAGSQRPRKVPVEMLTEMRRIYMFQLDFIDDLKHVWEFGIPRGVTPPLGHNFYMFDKDLRLESPSHGYYILNLEVGV
jgi:hypothetical protein